MASAPSGRRLALAMIGQVALRLDGVVSCPIFRPSPRSMIRSASAGKAAEAGVVQGRVRSLSISGAGSKSVSTRPIRPKPDFS